ncbi:MAG: pyridoxamine 5'-phosphate oxidase [Paracoccaceae bacterium]|nr:pyridoxamine 5'-phosphate oxidase [Paracoccaceae bacterium]
MTDRSGIFAGDDPIALVTSWLAEAKKTELNDAIAVSLATVDQSGMPNVRIVLLKEIEDNAFVFYTNYESAKGQELISSGKAALNFHWKSLRRQVRIRGLVETEDGAQADAYYNSRPLDSRIGAWASQQSRPLLNREELENAVRENKDALGASPERPPHWGGFRIKPLEMEFWADGPNRLHDRFKWEKLDIDATWTINRLNP